MLIWYLVGINLLAFLLCGVDKQRAKRGKWRIREATLFFISVIGGAVGMLAGMFTFRHKTRKRAFRWGIPAILLVQVGVPLSLYLCGVL